MRTYVSAHTKAIVVGRQIDRKIVGITFQQESWPTIDRAWCTMRVRTSTHIMRAVALCSANIFIFNLLL
jgi:hypothetical protein